MDSSTLVLQQVGHTEAVLLAACFTPALVHSRAKPYGRQAAETGTTRDDDKTKKAVTIERSRVEASGT